MKNEFLANMKQARGFKLWEQMFAQYPPAEIQADFMWSDQHFGHKNIIRYSDRPFADLDEMRETMISNYNRVVQGGSCVWVGDVAFLPDSEANEILHRCMGRKILIIGNHDLHKKKGLKKLHFDEIYAMAHMGSYTFTHYPMQGLPAINIHGHEHVNGNETLVSDFHINVNVEFINYTPIEVPK
jgi:calcineurin-like phosphoesterase family protein